MTVTIRNLHVQTLCVKAQQDESSLKFDLPDEIFGFHAQQSCEKLFKALISSHAIVYPRIHSLEKLIALMLESGEVLPTTPFDLAQLEPFAVEIRYELAVSFSQEDRQAIRDSVAILREHTLVRILELERRRLS